MGGGTTRVGDPSGKDESRRILTDEMIGENLKGIRQVFSKFLKFEGQVFDGKPGNALMANNADWLNTLNYIDFLRDVGRHFSVNRMLSFDSVKMRLDRQQELSFLEFNYMILQAYDFVELHKRTGCVLQMGGSDQWGNIINGIDLGRRMAKRATVCADRAADHDLVGRQDGQDRRGRRVAQRRHGVAVRLLAISGATPRTADVARFLKLFTVLPLDEIARLSALQGSEINEAKKVLANEATAMVHGRAAAEAASRDGSQDVRGGRAFGKPADHRSAERRTGQPRRAGRLREGRPRHLERRRAPSDQGRRPQGQRRHRHRREDGALPRHAPRRKAS